MSYKILSKVKNISTNIQPAVWEAFGLPAPIPEYKFHKKRKWRIDYAWPDIKLAVEIEGGAYTNGRHTRPVGFVKDMNKYNQLTMYGYYLLRFTPKNIDFNMISNLYITLKCLRKCE
jgi:very-short-patch-repair endonuclease